MPLSLLATVQAMPGPPMQLSEFIACVILLGIGAAIAFGVHLYAGYRQFRDGRGSLLRYLLVTVAVTVLTLLPAATALLLAAAVTPRDDLLLPAMIATVLCLIALARFLHPPGYWKLTGQSLDEVRDQEFLGRLQELSRRIGVRTPVVRLFPSLGGDMIAHAAAGGLPAPSLVVSDGILHRLAPAESDAVVAHELAHIRNRSLWLLAATAPLAGIAALLTTGVLSQSSAVLFGAALYIGLFRIVSRRLEFDCDRRAGEANGYETTFSALAKVHAILPLHNTGLRSLLLYATATHPSRDERLAALARRMPAPPPESAEWSPRAARRRRAAAWVAAILWASLLAAALLIASRDPDTWWPWIIGLALIVAPFAFQVWAVKAEFRREAKRMQSSKRWTTMWASLLTFVLVTAVTFLYVINADEINLWLSDSPFGRNEIAAGWLTFVIGIGILVLLLLLHRLSGHPRLELEIATALQQHNWQRALELGEQKPRQAARSAAARHNLALAKWKLGRCDEARADLERLRQDDKTLKQTWLTLALMHFELQEPERALEVAGELQRDSRRDPVGHFLASRALREMHRLDEAEAALEQARKLSPDDPTATAGEAMLLLSRGDIAGAQRALAEVERRSPGDTILPFIAAEIAFAAADLAAARRHVDDAAKLVRVNPFTMMERRLQRLQARLAREDRTQPLDIVDWIEDDAAVPRNPVS